MDVIERNMTRDELRYQESIKDDLEEFFAAPSKDKLPNLLQAEKEYDYLDFKSEWHEKSKLARHILAFSNSGGGAIIIGVDEKSDGGLKSEGVDDPLDESDFGNKVEKYIPDNAHNQYIINTFSYGDIYDDEISGLTFQVVFIEGAGELAPLVATNGGKSIDEGSIYVRRNTKSAVANYEEVQSLLKKSQESEIGKETAELHEELRQLRTLYSETNDSMLFSSTSMMFAGYLIDKQSNFNFSGRAYEKYIMELIEKKKKKIENRLGVD